MGILLSATEWAQVGGDPAPGDVSAFEALARVFSTTAEDAADARRSLTKLASSVDSAIWEGPAAGAFRAKIKELPPQLRKLHDSYDTASGAMRTYGRILGELQRRAERALGDVAAAEGDESSQTQALTQAVTADPKANTHHYDQAIENARQRLRSARSEIDDIREDRKGAENRLVGQLRTAGDKGIQNERWGGLKRFLKAIGDVCEVIALVLTVIAIVVIVVVALTNPIGWAALAAALAAAGPLLTAASVLGGVAFATKVGRLALGDESVSKGALALDAALMIAGPAGKLGGRLARGLAAAGRVARSADEADDAVRISRHLDRSQLWFDETTLDKHFRKHRFEFGAQSADEYARMTGEFFESSLQRGLPTKIDDRGIIRIYDPASDSFAVFDPSGSAITYFKVDPTKIRNVDTALEYWDIQDGVPPWNWPGQ